MYIERILTKFERMLDKLFAPKTTSSTPAGESVFAIGDIHGRLDLLEALLQRLDDEGAREAGARLVFLGDYIDRGPDIRGVVDRLVALKAERPNSVFLMGNHEQVFTQFIAAPEQRADWLDWGGEETLLSYGLRRIASFRADELGQELSARLPEAHRTFLADLPLSATSGDYFFAHAGVKPGVPLDQQTADDLLWIREPFHEAAPEARPEKVIVHGHHPVRKPLDCGWRIAIDTGAVYGGRLTAVALEGSKRKFVSV